MQYLRILLGVLKLAPYIATAYRKWQAAKAQKQKQEQVNSINESPKETFADEFGAASGSVQLTTVKPKKLPPDTDKP
mgnify:CR=1 FL=1|tara:strand:+ start:8947 stop:9177 length:231 start_codon:yes stop_codon:yes gene_type:complete